MHKNLLKVIATNNSFQNFLTSYFSLISNPDLILQKIGGRIEKLNDITYDPHVNALIQSRKAGCLSLEWQLIGDAKTEEERLLIDNIFKDLKVNEIMKDMLEFPFYGYVVMEILWQYQGKYIIPKTIISKPQHWFGFDNKGLLYYTDNSKKDFIEHRKFLLLQNSPTYKNPYGKALLSMCYFASIYKKEAVKFWLTYVEKYGMPLLHGKLPLGATQEMHDKFLDDLDDLKQDGVVVTKEGMGIDKLEVSSGSIEIYNTLIDFFNNEMSKAVLSQTLTTENNTGVGSYAMSKTHSGVRQDVVDADKKVIESKFNELISWVVDINFGYKTDIKFELYEEEDVDLHLAQRDATLMNTKNIKFTKSYYMNNYGFKESDFEIPEITQPAFAENDSKQFDEETDAFDLLTSTVDKNILDVCLKAIENGKDIDIIEKDLLNLYPNLNTQQIEDLLTVAILNSNNLGISEV